ncbi:hypothetical protein GGD83_003107 [Rhodoblastus sphagnicola]|nr:DUF1194 domain-containing protein [Rhodoblastus sphagnicola]MBB4199293.1 hypothetical protein [Rhodoblastus sphagnicola]
MSLFRLIALAVGLLGLGFGAARAQQQLDIALILAVDVSGSMDDARYRVQFEGIARALDDESVIQSLIGGQRHAMAIAMLAWSDKAEEVMPWRIIASSADAHRIASLIRSMPRVSGEFTCLAGMLRQAREGLVRSVPGQASRVIIDVSGDGPDNCSGAHAAEDERDKTIAEGVTINGLPIRTENEVVGTGAYRAPGFGIEELRNEPHASGVTIEDWYKQHVIGGPSAFNIVANGYHDFERAFRRKFLIEIASGVQGQGQLSMSNANPSARAGIIHRN